MSGIDKIRGDTRSYGPEDYKSPDDETKGDVRKVVSPSEMDAASVDKKDKELTTEEKAHKEHQQPGHFPDFMEESEKKKEKTHAPPPPEIEKLIKLEEEYLEARLLMEKRKQSLRDEMGHGTSGNILQRLEEQFVLAENEMKKKRKKVINWLKTIATQEKGS